MSNLADQLHVDTQAWLAGLRKEQEQLAARAAELETMRQGYFYLANTDRPIR